MRVKFEILADDTVDEIDSDFDGAEYIKVKRDGDKLIVIVTTPINVMDLENGNIY